MRQAPATSRFACPGIRQIADLSAGAAMTRLFATLTCMTPETSDPAFRIRIADERDASGILACLAAAFAPYRDAYTPGAFADTVPASLLQRMSQMTVLVAERAGEIVGTISCSGHDGHLRGMAVAPGW